MLIFRGVLTDQKSSLSPKHQGEIYATRHKMKAALLPDWNYDMMLSTIRIEI